MADTKTPSTPAPGATTGATDATEQFSIRALKVVAIGVVFAVLVGFGIERGGGLPDLDGPSTGDERAAGPPPGVAVLDGEATDAPFRGRWNGQEVFSQRFSSDLEPPQVADLYAEHFRRSSFSARKIEDLDDLEDVPTGRARLLAEPNRIDTPYYSIVTSMNEEGEHIGVVAYARYGGGSTYFLSQTAGSARPGERPATSVRRDDPIPAPPFSEERFSVDGIGEEGSHMTLYHSRADRSRILKFYRESLAADGWACLEDEGAIIRDSMKRGYLLLFRRGTHEAIVATMPREGKIEAVTVLYRARVDPTTQETAGAGH